MSPVRAFALVCALQGGLSPLATAQTFSKRYDVFGQDQPHEARGIEPSVLGGFVVAGGGYYVSPDSLLYNVVFTQWIDEQGVQLGEERIFKPLHAVSPGWRNCLSPFGGGFMLGGGTESQSGLARPALMLFDAVGDSVHFLEYISSTFDWICRQGKPTPDGGFILSGETDETGGVDVFLLKLDSLMNVEWVHTYGDPVLQEFGATVELVSDGGYLIGGQLKISQNNFDQWIMRADSLGNLIWEGQYGSPFNDAAVANLQAISDGNFLMASSWGILNSSIGFPVLMKFDTAGTVLWAQQHGDFGSLRAVKECANNDLIAAGGVFPGVPSYGPLGTLLRTNSAGDSLWMRYYLYEDSLMNDGLGEFMDVVPTVDGGFIAVGRTNGSLSGIMPPGYTQDVWIVRVDSMGCLVPGCHLSTGLQSQITNYKDALCVAPNPASSATQLTWQLPGTITTPLLGRGAGGGGARLSVVSSDGRLVAVKPIDLASGSYALDVRDLPPGVYWLHVVAEGSWVMGAKLIVE